MLTSIPSTFTLQRTNRKGLIEQAPALPLRLVPYATGEIISSKELVNILAEPDSPMPAHVLAIGESAPCELPPKHWKMLQAQHISKNTPLADVVLPAGVFVWLDSLDYVYDFYFTSDRREPGWTLGERALMEISKEIWVEETTVSTLLEGFEKFFNCLTSTGPTASLNANTRHPQGLQPGTAKRWSDEVKHELAEYREKHGTKKTAEHFGISEQRVRQLLPRDKPKKASFFHTP